MKKVTIGIAKASEEEVAVIPGGSRLGDIDEKFKKIDQILFGIIAVLIFSLVAIIIAVVGLFLDQMRYNNVAYREYSDKIGIVTTNHDLLEQNKQNHTLILELQAQLSDLLQ